MCKPFLLSPSTSFFTRSSITSSLVTYSPSLDSLPSRRFKRVKSDFNLISIASEKARALYWPRILLQDPFLPRVLQLVLSKPENLNPTIKNSLLMLFCAISWPLKFWVISDSRYSGGRNSYSPPKILVSWGRMNNRILPRPMPTYAIMLMPKISRSW